MPARKARSRLNPLPATLIMLATMLLLGGCESLGYYTHLAGGQLALLRDRQSVDSVLEELGSATDEESTTLVARLELSKRVLEYAEQRIGLDVGGRYRSYVVLDRDAVVWNVFAAPSLSLNPHTWCYPFVGCAPYRGYFAEDRARKQQAELRGQGLETYVGAVAAYSTLGWFDDPLLSTFMDMREADFIELLLHELSHSRVWIRDDAAFNESFASFVGRQGAQDWYLQADQLGDFEDHLAIEAAWRRASVVLEETRDALRRVYSSDSGDSDKTAAKAEVLELAASCLTAMAQSTGHEGYRRLIPRLNNAYLASLATYADGLPAFAAMFRESGEDWSEFFNRVDELTELPVDERNARLAASEAATAGSDEQQVTAAGDDDGADQVQCEALSGHRFDAEVTRAEHDDVRGGGDG